MAAAASSKPPLTLKDGSQVKVLSFDVTGTLIVHRQATFGSAFALLCQGINTLRCSLNGSQVPYHGHICRGRGVGAPAQPPHVS